MVEDSDDDAELVERTLRAGGVEAEIVRARDRESFERALGSRCYDAVLSDFRLPGLEAPEVLSAVRAREPDVPFLCVSGTIGEEQAVELLKSGATDYVLKDRPGRLVPCLRRALAEARERAERRRAQEELRIAREQFHQAQKMEAVGRLAGGVAHDFNNILTTISGYGELLQQALPPDSPLAEDAGEIVSAAARAERLTRQLLALGRRQVLEVRALDLNEVVRGLDRLLRRVIGEDVRIVLTLDPRAPRLRADAGQLEQVLMNLAVNARDAMPAGGTLTIATAAAGARVALTVSDTGVGMTREVAARVFEPFFTTKERGKGTGLGLASVHGIVTQSGGEIALESAPGRGTVFRLSFPATDETPDALPSRASGSPRPVLGRTVTALLVEDERSLRRLMSRVLAEHGFRVLSASGAREAGRLAAREPDIDLAVLDVILPELGGPALADRLREARPDLKVLFISGFADQTPPPAPVRGRPHAFLPKPFTARELVEKIHEILAFPA
jgi:signal transduction histidine kinase